MNIFKKNQRAMAALGIRAIEWKKQDRLTAVWDVTLEDGGVIEIRTPGLGTESSVIRLVAEKLKDRPVRYPSTLPA